MRKTYPDLMIKLLQEIKKKSIYFFQISALCIGLGTIHSTVLISFRTLPGGLEWEWDWFSNRIRLSLVELRIQGCLLYGFSPYLLL